MENKNDQKKVLVIDDDDNLRTVLPDKLNISGFETDSATDGEEGLNKAFHFHPDIILLDMLMPKMNGLEVLEKLREDKWGQSVKVMMLTVLEDTNTVAQAVDKGTLAYVLKTDHNLDDVVKQVEEILNSQ